jgi:hypothetical protein
VVVVDAVQQPDHLARCGVEIEQWHRGSSRRSSSDRVASWDRPRTPDSSVTTDSSVARWAQ